MVNGTQINFEALPRWVKSKWVPILYRGPYKDAPNLKELADGLKEQVSGKELHISEGIVIKPSNARYSKEGFDLQLKVISKNYKDLDSSS